MQHYRDLHNHFINCDVYGKCTGIIRIQEKLRVGKCREEMDHLAPLKGKDFTGPPAPKLAYILMPDSPLRGDRGGGGGGRGFHSMGTSPDFVKIEHFSTL